MSNLPAKNRPKDEVLLKQLRDALLRDDRQQVAEVREIVETQEELSKRIDPIIERHMEELHANFPNAYVKVVQKLIDQRITARQEEIVTLLAPRLGAMIRQYIASFFRELNENLESRIRKSPMSFIYRNRDKSTEEMILNAMDSKIEEAYVISHESGLLIGSASASETADKDMIAGMLTAIRGFAGDAFNRVDEELSSVRYGSYEIMVHNFFNYYIALAVGGQLTESERSALQVRILEFASKVLRGNLSDPEPAFYADLQAQLSKYFIEPYQQPKLNEK